MRAFACAILFLTRIPLPTLALSERDVRDSPRYYAWVGALLALLLAGAAQLFVPLGPRLAALLVVVLWVLITGALHLDGLADTIDGLSGGRGDPARALAIMRDSRIGAHGAVAITLVLLVKWAALEHALVRGDASWLIAPALARFGCTALMAYFPYAREAGLGAPYVGAVDARALSIGALAVLPAFFLNLHALIAGAVAVLVVAPFAVRIARGLGGLTGDVYGAAIELLEVATLVAAALPRLH